MASALQRMIPDERKVRVLLVEDDHSCAELVCDCLGDAARVEFEVSKAVRLATAVEALQSEMYDAMLVDVAHCEHARRETLDAATALATRLPVILLTGTEDDTLGRAGDARQRVARCNLVSHIMRAIRRYRRLGAEAVEPTIVRIPGER